MKVILNSRSVLIALGVTPIYLLLNSSLSTSTIVSVLVYIISWSARFVARRHDPEENILRTFVVSSYGQVTLLGSVLIIQWFALSWTGEKTLIVALTLLAFFFLLWATSRSEEALWRRVAEVHLTIATLAICLIFAEVTLRVIASRRPPNGYRTVTWGHPVRNNSLGFREREFESPKPNGSFRIMVVGDSLTWGAGLPTEKRYSNVLEKRLNVTFPEKPIEVLNFGISGGPTVRERDIVYTHIGKTDPDLIIIGFCINDPQPRGENYAVELEKYRWLFTLFHDLGTLGFRRTAGFLRDRIDQFLRNVGLVPQWQEALDRTYDENSTEWREFKIALRDIKSISDSRNLPSPIFAPLLQGTGDFNNPNTSLEHILKWCRQAANTAKDLGFVVLNMEDEFKSQGYRDRWVNPWDGHPSAECNEIYARQIASVVSELISGD